MKPAVAVLAALPTAVLLFVSSSVPMYLNNQQELHHQTSVLAPFVAMFVASWVVGAASLVLSARRLFCVPAWAYVLFGPLLLLYRFLTHAVEGSAFFGWLLEGAWGLAAGAVVFLVAVVLLSRRAEPGAVFAPLAIFGVVLIGNEIVSFVSRVERPPPRARPSLDGLSTRGELPNVYHIVLDALQTDVLELLPDEELRPTLGGTILLEDHTAVYHSTVMSLGSMFTSTRYANDRPRGTFVTTSFGGASFVSLLRNAGYRSIAVVPASDPVGEGVFDQVLLHTENFGRSVAASTGQFRNLWVLANTPRPILEALLSSAWLDEDTKAELRLTQAGRGLTDAAPVASLSSFEALIEQEDTLPAHGRYTFIHLLIPHAPYVLEADCSYQIGVRASEPTPQTRCTLDALGAFLERLDSLGRFDDSIILVHGDHGAPFRRRKNELVPSRARSLRTPLFVKPAARERTEPPIRCAGDATLVDVAPTLFDLIGISSPLSFEGISRAPAIASCLENARADNDP